MEDYQGWKIFSPAEDEDTSAMFSRECENRYGCITNEYLIAADPDGVPMAYKKCVGDKLVTIPYVSVNSQFLGKIKPRNPQQIIAMDMLLDNSTTVDVLTGRFGAGKDFLMCACAMSLIENQKFEKIVFIRNNIEVKDTKPIGFLPGDYNEKMLQYAMPLADHLGGAESLDMLVKRGAIEVVHLGLIRGREFRDSIIICDESQNMTTEQIQLVIGRVGDNSRLWINGDIKQCDMEVFRRNSGLQRAIDRLKGNPLFGYVHLVKTERSKTAALADLLD